MAKPPYREMNQHNQIDDAETFEIALGKSKDMEDDSFLMENIDQSTDNNKLLGKNKMEIDDESEACDKKEETNNRHGCCPQINTSLLAYKGFYFFFLAAIGSLIPFLAVFYKQLWLSAKQTGVLLGIGPLIKMVAIPMWGIIVDFYKQSKFIFIMSLVAWLVAHYSISLVSPVFRQSYCKDNSFVTITEDIIDGLSDDKVPLQNLHQVNASTSSAKVMPPSRTTPKIFEANDKTKARDFLRKLKHKLSRHKHHITQTELASEVLTLIESHNSTNITEIENALTREKLERVFDFLNMQGHYPWPIDTVVDYKNTTESEEWENDHNTYLFTVLFVITAVGTLLCSPTLTLADIAILQKLGDNKQNYGKQRLWGSFGYGAGAFVVGACISTIQEVKGCNNPLSVDYMPCFYTFAILMGISVLIGGLLEFDDQHKEEQSIFQGIGSVLCNYEYIYFISTILFCGCATGVIQTFLFWHLEDIGGTQFLFSCIAVVQCISDVLMYFCSGAMITWLGHQRVLYAGLVCYTVRFLGYALISNSWVVLPFELLHGVTNAAVWSAGVVFVGLSPGAPSTLQGILGGVYSGLGCGGGGMIGGFIVGAVGCRYTFLLLAAISFLDLVLFAILNNCSYWHCHLFGENIGDVGENKSNEND